MHSFLGPGPNKIIFVGTKQIPVMAGRCNVNCICMGVLLGVHRLEWVLIMDICIMKYLHKIETNLYSIIILEIFQIGKRKNFIFVVGLNFRMEMIYFHSNKCF